MNTTHPDPLYGFQLCSAGDPQRTHWLTPYGGWERCLTARCMCPACLQKTYLKPIPLPDGLPVDKSEWELVPEDEQLNDGCKFYRPSNGDWRNESSCCAGLTPKSIAEKGTAFARRKQPVQKVGEWVEIATHGRPTEPGRYWCWDGRKPLLLFKIPHPETSWAGITHWMKCELPETPPKSRAEKAWEEIQDEAKDWSPKAMFLAGFAKGGGR